MSDPPVPPPTSGSSAAGAGGSAADPYAELLTELDRSVQTIRDAALRLKKAADGMQAVERNTDRILASTRMLEINVSDLVRDTEGFASWEDDSGS